MSHDTNLLSTIESTKETLTELAAGAAAKAGGLSSTASDKAGDLASAASDKLEGVDAKNLKSWWPVAAIMGALVALGVVRTRSRTKVTRKAKRRA